MKLLNILTPLLSLLLLGCGENHHSATLDQAERLMHQHPDSAYMLLSPIHLADFEEDEQSRARFALLYTMAIDHTGKKMYSDSLTNAALWYYEDHGTEYQRAAAYYYSARIDYHWHDIPEAVEMLTYAQEIAPRDSLHLQCMISKYMGYLYSYQFDYNRALKRFQKGYKLAVQLDDKPNQASISMELYSQYAGLKKYELAETHIRRSRDLYYELLDSVNMLKSECKLARCRVRNGENPARVRAEYLRERAKFPDRAITSDEHMMLAELYDKDNMVDSALYHINQAINIIPRTLKERVVLHQRVAMMHSISGRYREAFNTLTKVNKYQNRFYKESLSSANSRLSERHKSKLYKERLQSLESEKRGIIVLSICLILLLFSLLYIIIRRYKTRLRILDERLGVAQDLAQAVANSQAMLSDGEDEPLSNINFIMSRLNNLIEKMPKYESDPHKFIDEFVALMRREKIPHGDSRTIFSQIIDREYNGVLTKLGQRHSLDSNEIEILSMVALGVSNNAMRIILDHTNNRTIYNLRSSIKSKLNIPIDSHSVLELLSREGEQIS